MAEIYLERKDETVDRIIKAAFPGFTGKNIIATITDKVRFSGTQWDSGEKSDYVIIALDGYKRIDTLPVAPFMQSSELHEKYHAIPPGIVVVEEHRGRYHHINIYANSENITPMLPAPVDLPEDERIVLSVTKSLKPAGRFDEAHNRTGITQARYDAAKAALIGKKLLNAAGAITITGKNAIKGYPRL